MNFARPADNARVLDVGCSSGALATELVGRSGSAAGCGVDPSDGLVTAATDGLPACESSEVWRQSRTSVQSRRGSQAGFVGPKDPHQSVAVQVE